MNPDSFVDTVAVEPDSEFEQFLSSYRSMFPLDGRSLESLQADLSSLQRHQEPHLRSRLFTITEGLESLRSPFVVMAEPCLRDISLGGGKDWNDTVMGATMAEVLARKRQGDVKPGATTTSRSPQSTQERPRKSGFIFPDLALLMHCPCGDPECPFLDSLASAEVKALQHVSDHRRICERVELAVSLWHARRALDARILLSRSLNLRPFTETFESTVIGAINGMNKIDELADFRLLSAIDDYEVPPSTRLHVIPNPVASSAGEPLQWSIPSPALSSLMPTVLAPPATDADTAPTETVKGAAPAEEFWVWYDMDA